MASKNPIYQHNLSNQSLKDHFLIAMPGLTDSAFSNSITYICDHSEHGAMGIVLNRPLDVELTEVFDHLSIDYPISFKPIRVLSGGPVSAQQGFVLHKNEGEWDSTMPITDEICLTASQDIVEALAQNTAPKNSLFVLGYAGWGAGQLETEIFANSWLTMPADHKIIFNTKMEDRWTAAANQLGIDMNLISATAGHA